MAFDPGEKGYPPEWVKDDDGRNPRCTAFQDRDKPAPVKDCPGQTFLFGAGSEEEIR